MPVRHGGSRFSVFQFAPEISTLRIRSCQNMHHQCIGFVPHTVRDLCARLMSSGFSSCSASHNHEFKVVFVSPEIIRGSCHIMEMIYRQQACSCASSGTAGRFRSQNAIATMDQDLTACQQQQQQWHWCQECRLC